MTDKTYKIVRFFADGDKKTIARGMTLKEAQDHCRDKETSSSTATSNEAKVRAIIDGAWFDGFYEE